MSAPINVLLFYDLIIIFKAIVWVTSAEMSMIFDYNNWHLARFEIKKGIIDDLKEYIGKQKVFDDIRLVVIEGVAETGVVPDERFV